VKNFKKRYLAFLLISILIHYVFFTFLPEYWLKISKRKESEDTLLYLVPIPKGPSKITFSNQKVNYEKPDEAQFLAEHDNKTPEEVKNKNEQKPVLLKNPHVSPEIKLSDEGDTEVKSALRKEQIEYPSLEEYLENFKDEDNIREDDYVSINTVSFKYISYFKRLKQKIEFVLNLPEEAAVRGITGQGIVGFSISADGELLDTEILETTGYTVLDAQMLGALERASPFEPLPESMGLDMLKIKSVFSFRYHYSYH